MKLRNITLLGLSVACVLNLSQAQENLDDWYRNGEIVKLPPFVVTPTNTHWETPNVWQDYIVSLPISIIASLIGISGESSNPLSQNGPPCDGVKEDAEMASKAYDDGASNVGNNRPLGVDDLWAKGSDVLQAEWQAMTNDSNSGFHATVFVNSDTGHVTIAYRGTEPGSIGDWVANAENGLGMEATQYDEAVALANMVTQLYGASNVTLVGHSLGGGLASTASIATGAHATTFNAAGVAQSAASRYGATLSSADSLVDAFYLGGDILSLGQDLPGSPAPAAIGTRYRLEAANQAWDPLTRHLMAQVIASLPC